MKLRTCEGDEENGVFYTFFLVCKAQMHIGCNHYTIFKMSARNEVEAFLFRAPSVFSVVVFITNLRIL